MVAALIRSRLHLFTDGFYYPNICKRAVEGSLDTLVNELADEIIYLYDTTQNYKREPILSRIFTIPIYLGEDLNYLCCVRFLLYKQTNKLDILWLGNLKDNPDTSSQLPAPR